MFWFNYQYWLRYIYLDSFRLKWSNISRLHLANEWAITDEWAPASCQLHQWGCSWIHPQCEYVPLHKLCKVAKFICAVATRYLWNKQRLLHHADLQSVSRSLRNNVSITFRLYLFIFIIFPRQIFINHIPISPRSSALKGFVMSLQLSCSLGL